MFYAKRRKEIQLHQKKKIVNEEKKRKDKELLKRKKVHDKKKLQEKALDELFGSVDKKDDSKGASSHLKDLLAEEDALGGLVEEEENEDQTDDNVNEDMEIQLDEDNEEQDNMLLQDFNFDEVNE
jgi:hypothetical protein